MNAMNPLKKKISGCAKVAMSEIETECVFWINESHSDFDRVTDSLAEVSRVLESRAVDQTNKQLDEDKNVCHATPNTGQ